MVHQVFLKLIEQNGLDRATDKKAYLFACVRNAALNERKYQSRNVELNPDSGWFISTTPDVTEEAALQHALIKLPGDQREVMVLHIWGELTFSQIGELLDVSANTAASRYRYALTKLKESMFTKEDLHASPGR